MKSRAPLLALLFAWPLSCIAQVVISPGIPDHRSFLSPDRSRSVTLYTGDFEIKDKRTGDVALVEERYNPVYAIAWSTDSRSIFVAAHVARGLTVQLLHLEDSAANRWLEYQIDDRESESHESVALDWSVKPKKVTLVCKVTLQKENGRTYRCYKATFDVDPSTGKTSNFRKKFLTFSNYDKLKSKFVPE